MNKTLATFMTIAITTFILTSLLIGVVFDSLSNKNTHHTDVLKQEHQIKPK